MRTEAGWISVSESNQEMDAVTKKALLEEEGIQTMIINKKDSLYPMIGYFEIFVKQENVLRSLKLLEQYENSRKSS